MENSILYNILSKTLLAKWRAQIIKKDECGLGQEEKNIAEILRKELSEENNKTLNDYALAIENKIDFIYYNLSILILNFGIKVGMEIQQAFIELEEK